MQSHEECAVQPALDQIYLLITVTRNNSKFKRVILIKKIRFFLRHRIDIWGVS